jgi:signal transduction histidine kinase
LSVLLNDLLDLERSRQPRPEMQSVLPVLQHCVGLVERQAEMQNASIRLENEGEDLHTLFDSQQLTQAVVNLLLNALEASPEGGRIHVRAFHESGIAKIEITDEGPGLDPDQQEHLFEPFYTTKTAGTGLGLAVSRELMRSQGGDVVYAALNGTGARFVVELPKG